MSHSLLFLMLFITASIFLIAVTLAYRLRDQKLQAQIIELNRLKETLEEDAKRQDERILQLQRDCRLMYREQFSEIRNCLERAIVLKDEKTAREQYIQRLEHQLAFFSSKDWQAERELFIDQRTGGIMTSLRRNVNRLKDDDYQFLVFLILGFDATLICMITGMSSSNYYTRKSRLKEKILSADTPDVSLYQQWIF
ncbi:MAG: hypothetical protein J6M31_07830 [Bacteroidales bacterium]|nr:hypothetical protein [Bacteroidales bacterium]